MASAFCQLLRYRIIGFLWSQTVSLNFQSCDIDNTCSYPYIWERFSNSFRGELLDGEISLPHTGPDRTSGSPEECAGKTFFCRRDHGPFYRGEQAHWYLHLYGCGIAIGPESGNPTMKRVLPAAFPVRILLLLLKRRGDASGWFLKVKKNNTRMRCTSG